MNRIHHESLRLAVNKERHQEPHQERHKERHQESTMDVAMRLSAPMTGGIVSMVGIAHLGCKG